MATTTNYGWDTPDDTDLVKDGAAAIRTLGNSIDTTTKNLNPETTTGDIAYRSATANTNTRLAIGSTGQVLTVAAGVPSWATPTDQTPLTTKGDVFTFSTVDARLGVGANGTVLTADSAESTGLKWAAPVSGMTSIASGSLSGSTTTISSISGSYNNLVLIVRDYYGSTNGSFEFRLNGDSTSNFYIAAYLFAEQGGSAGTGQDVSTKFGAGMGAPASSDKDNFATITINDYAGATKKAVSIHSVYEAGSTNNVSAFRAGYYRGTSAITSIDLLMSIGTWSGGTYILYGVK